MKATLDRKLVPLGDRVIIRQKEADEVSKGGILLPRDSQEKPKEGEVVAIGPGRLNEAGERAPMEVKAGDRVIFNKYAGTEIKVDGNEWMILTQNEIIAIVR